MIFISSLGWLQNTWIYLGKGYVAEIRRDLSVFSLMDTFKILWRDKERWWGLL